MTALGSLGNFYVLMLLIFLVGGIVVISIKFAQTISNGTGKLIKIRGGKYMNKWFKLAAASFAGVLIASFALGLMGAGASVHGADSSGSLPGSFQSAHNHGSNSSGMATQGISAVGPVPVSYVTAGYNQQQFLYQMQMQMMQMQQQINQLMQMNMNQMNSGMSGMSGGSGGGMGMM